MVGDRSTRMVDAFKSAAVTLKKKLFDQLKSQRATNNRGHRATWFVPESDDSRGCCGGGKTDWDAVYQEMIDTERAAPAYEDFDTLQGKKARQQPLPSTPTPKPARGDCGGEGDDDGGGGEATLDSLVALYAYAAQEDGHLSFERGERLDAFVDERQAWWLASNVRGQVGLVPSNYLSAASEPAAAPQTPSIDATEAPNYQPKSLPQPAKQLRPRPAPRDASRRRSSAPAESHGASPQQQPAGSSSRRRASEAAAIAEADAADGECSYATLDSGGLAYFHGGIGRDQCENLLVREGDFLLRDSRGGQLTLSVKGKERIHHFLIATLADGGVAIGRLAFPLFSKLVDHYREHAIYKSDSQRLLLGQPVTREQHP